MNPKLLIVEDNQLTSTLLATIFSGLDFEIKEIERGDEVLPYLSKNKVDAIILDLELPGMSGDQIYGNLKTDRNLRDIPVIPFTAHVDIESEQSYSRKLIRTGLMKERYVPHIVYKISDSESQSNITKELIDEVARALLTSKLDLPAALVNYYKENEGLEREKISEYLKKKIQQNPNSKP